MNIVLDLDGTLVGLGFNYEPIARPWLKQFLFYCFSTFKHVILWTAALTEWVEVVQNYIFAPIFYELWVEHNLLCNWTLILTRENCCIFNHGNQVVVLKDLYLLYRWGYPSFMFNITKENTVVVDDTECTYSLNPDNAIPIDTYIVDNHLDTQLLDTISLLDKYVKSHKKN